MCKICVEYDLQSMNWEEALTALQEVFDEKNEHHMDLWMKLLKDEMEPRKAKGCECGSDKLGHPGHSSWCPKFKRS